MAVGTPSAFFRSLMIFGAAALCATALNAALAVASEQRFTYRVHSSTYGDIGFYSTVWQKVGDITTIITEAHIQVSLLGVVLYRQDISRVERRIANNLVYFHGITTENGTSIELDGRAEGDYFRLTSPSGSVTVPGTIRTSDPWSAGAPGGDTMFMADTGVVTQVRTTGGELTSITIDGIAMRVRRYQIDTLDGKERYQVWMNDLQTPVMFDIVDSDGTVTFTLVR
jgi:hypothetical protein